MLIQGTVESGHGDAQRWLRKFNDAYSLKTGWRVFPGSLNLRLVEPFDWTSSVIRSRVVEFGREEYGGERDILLLPCLLRSCADQPGYFWSTTHATFDPDSRFIVEVIAPVGLRETYSLVDGDVIEVELPGLRSASA